MEIYNSSVKNIIEANRGQGDTIGFPHNYKSNYGMLFMFTDYDYNAVDQVVTRSSIGAYKGSVLLPLPNNGLIEGSQVNVGEAELGMKGALAAKVFSEGGVNSLLASMKDSFKSSETVDQKDIGGALLASAGLGLRSILSQNEIGQGISVATGQTINNFKALTFNGVNLRTHTFNWKFYPENPDDSVAVTKIRKKFMAAAHPTYAATMGIEGSRVLFGYPQIVLPVIIINESDTFFYNYRPCMIKDVEFNYAGEAGMSFIKGGRPASISMKLDLMEASIWTAEDYGRDFTGGNIDQQFADQQRAETAGSSRNGRQL